ESITASFMAEQLTHADGSGGAGYRIDERVFARQDPTNEVAIERIELGNPRRPDGWPATGDPLTVKIGYRAARSVATPWFAVQIEDPFGTRILELRSLAHDNGIGALHPQGCVELEVASLPLVGGRYALSISCGRGRASAFHLERVVEFHVWPADVYGSG